jgi:cell division protein FtsL
MYVYGSAAPNPVYEPERRRRQPRRRKKVSSQVKENRRQAMGINKAYVVFLSFAAVLMLVVCVNYVQLRSELTSRSKHITALQKELVSLYDKI